MRTWITVVGLALAGHALASSPSATDVDDIALSWVQTAPEFGGRAMPQMPSVRFVPMTQQGRTTTTDPILGDREEVNDPLAESGRDWIADVVLPTLSATAPMGSLVIAVGMLSLYGIRRATPA